MKKRFYKSLKSFFLPLMLVLSFSMVHAQTKTLTGKITSSEYNLGIPGVSVILKGSSQGTATDAEGNYSLNVAGSDAILVFTSIGFKSSEVLVGSASVVDQVLDPEITSLEEVVVVGYGTQKKVNLTGAVDQVSGEQLADRPIVSIGDGCRNQTRQIGYQYPSGFSIYLG